MFGYDHQQPQHHPFLVIVSLELDSFDVLILCAHQEHLLDIQLVLVFLSYLRPPILVAKKASAYGFTFDS